MPGRQNADIRPITVALRIVHSVAHNEMICNAKADVVCLDLFQSAPGLSRQVASLKLLGLCCQQPAKKSDRQSRI